MSESERPQMTNYLLVTTHPDGRLIQYRSSTEEERECIREWIFAELDWEPAKGSRPIMIHEYSDVASAQDG
jgi:hypothetical protein